ncbi:hypothetical protein J416_05518 [Gracilibacillus halophilus YIM-C55.5]|uniref:Uncharacterized protein n=1 Tax=Gracilibacillus halophilus YIM-C55.5 TaxID=1308866 RepID=N4WWJ2_9BACI|nr:YqhR family membrane protein [Gracilibacillus halophilus]ENH97446.1 hypothetical protein J416_05518 [Gracilibacillus halophilus YIM-C55.5]
MRYVRRKEEEKQPPIYPRVISVGFFGGFIWSVIAAIAGYFQFTEVTPKTIILRSWLQTSWSDQWLGQWISIFVISMLSIGIAFVFYLLFRKIKGIWIGIVFGLSLWALIFWLLEPIFENISPLYQMDSDTIVTTICLFILYGVFIGYSISFSYQQRLYENQ